MNSNSSMNEYYARRAAEYERIYQKPERQNDLRKLEDFLSNAFAGLHVLELACGTGYWTQFIARNAGSIAAVDINPEVLEIARLKNYGSCRVTFLESDIFSLPIKDSTCNAGFHAFWWSHIPVQNIDTFLRHFHSMLLPGSLVVMIDNLFVEGSSTPVSRKDDHGNTYQIRQLQDGSTYEILKNFPSTLDLRSRLEFFAHDIQLKKLEYYWIAQYRI